MAKSLRTLAAQLKKNHGFALIPSFDHSIEPGSILEWRRWNDINHIGKLTDDRAIRRADLGEIEGPIPCQLADFNRKHEMTVGAALDLLKPAPSANAEFNRAREVIASFESPVLYSASLFVLEDAIEQDPRFWDRTVGQHLRLKRRYVVYQIVRAKLSFFFRGGGSAGVDLRASKLGDLATVKLKTGWSWRNEATLESKKEILLAVEMARYLRKRKRLQSWPR